MMRCAHCGQELPEEGLFCPYCGEEIAPPLTDAEERTAPEAEPVPEAPEAEPVPEAPEAEPVPEAPETEPVPEAPEAEPVPEAPEAEPVPEAPETEPVPEAPEAEPVPDAPEERESEEDKQRWKLGWKWPGLSMESCPGSRRRKKRKGPPGTGRRSRGFSASSAAF